MWIYAIAWPESAAYLLAEDLVLHDLTEWVPAELVYGAPSPYLHGAARFRLFSVSAPACAEGATCRNLKIPTCSYTVGAAGTTARRRWGGWPEMPKKILTWGLVAFLVFFIAYRPASAATVFKQLGNSLVDIANGIGAFFSSLVS